MNGLMNIEQALNALGANRVIWIDDVFSNTQEDLANLLLANLDITRSGGFEEFSDIFEALEFDEDQARHDLSQRIHDLTQEQKNDLKKRFFSQEEIVKMMPTKEASSEQIEAVCTALRILQEDRWSFESFESKLRAVCDSNDINISYIVDLNNASGGERQGLDVLKTLKQYNSKGTAFLLTHETNAAGEAELELQLRNYLDEGQASYKEIPLCVIAKERLHVDEDEHAITNALTIAIKRAGLRRSMHEVLKRIEQDVFDAFNLAGSMLLQIPPEQLEEYVVERGRTEGASEFHIVERAITATVAQKLRDSFANNTSIQDSTLRLRALRSIALDKPTIEIHKHLEQFRKYEIWEPDTLINSSFTPLACGDVFEFDQPEVGNIPKKRYLLLGQPCDIAIRSTGSRELETAILIPLKVKADPQAGAAIVEDKLKEPLLPFRLDGSRLSCDFRSAISVRLDILDLATFREDGRVRFDVDQTAPQHLLPGLQTIFTNLSPRLNALLAERINNNSGEAVLPSEQLTISLNDVFKHVRNCKFKKPYTKKENGVVVLDFPSRLTWGLRRCGRVRMPYAGSLLRDYMNVMSRQAFDLEYVK